MEDNCTGSGSALCAIAGRRCGGGDRWIRPLPRERRLPSTPSPATAPSSTASGTSRELLPPLLLHLLTPLPLSQVWRPAFQYAHTMERVGSLVGHVREDYKESN